MVLVLVTLAAAAVEEGLIGIVVLVLVTLAAAVVLLLHRVGRAHESAGRDGG